MECKDGNTLRLAFADLIDTLWNVKLDLMVLGDRYWRDLIDTLWNVKEESGIVTSGPFWI